MTTDTTVPYKALREGLRPTPSQRAVERDLGWKTGHLSLIERGVKPTEEQHRQLMDYYVSRLVMADGERDRRLVKDWDGAA